MKKRTIAVVIVILAAVLLGWRSRGRRKPAAGTAPATAPAPATATATAPATATATATAPAPAPAIASESGAPIALTAATMVDFTRRAYDAYRETSKFPPTSRPARSLDEIRHILDWNRGDFRDERLADDPRDPSPLQVRVALDRSLVDRGQPLTVTADVVPDVPAEITAVEQLRADGDGDAAPWRDGARLTFQKGIARFVPGPGDLQRRIAVTVRAEHLERTLFLDFSFVDKPPLTVTGKRRENVEHGSLRIGLDVDVAEPGFFVVRALLVHGDTPLGVFEDQYTLTQPGRHEIPLTFFGKIITDRGVDGPYEIRALHGAIFKTGSPLAHTWHHDAPIATAAHRAADFSDAEWESPQKTARLKHYEEALGALSPSSRE